MHLFWLGNYTSQSGYSQQARLFIPRLLNLGHKVTVLEIGGGISAPRKIGGVTVYSPFRNPFFTDVIEAHVQKLKGDAILSMFDTWGVGNPEAFKPFHWFPITPLDHVPAPPAVIQSVSHADAPIAMSQFGVEMLSLSNLHPLYLPLAYDPTVMWPHNKAVARRTLGWPEDQFIVLFVGMNDSVPSRKGIPELLEAWSIFKDRHADAMLYMHTSDRGGLDMGNAVGGVEIPLIRKTLGMENDQSMVFSPPYEYFLGFPAAKMADLYSAADVLVLPSRGEGFGLPLVEAQACGCPVITTGFAAGKELCASNWFIEFETQWTFQSAYAAHPRTASIVSRLEEAYEHRDDEALRFRSIEFVRPYRIDEVARRYLPPLLDAIGEASLS